MRSRVDRLGPGPREAIVAASVLGPEFGLSALRTVTDLDGGLSPRVSELCSAGLLSELRKRPEPTYRFRHGLIQEATYQGLLRAQRRRLHARAAWGLEEASAGRLEEAAGVLGHHYAMAGETERARITWALPATTPPRSSPTRRPLRLTAGRWSCSGGPWATGEPGGRVLAQVGGHLLAYWAVGRGPPGFTGGGEPFPPLGPGTGCAGSTACWGRLRPPDHRHEEALAALDAAAEHCTPAPDKDADDWARTWLDVQLALAAPPLLAQRT